MEQQAEHAPLPVKAEAAAPSAAAPSGLVASADERGALELQLTSGKRQEAEEAETPAPEEALESDAQASVYDCGVCADGRPVRTLDGLLVCDRATGRCVPFGELNVHGRAAEPVSRGGERQPAVG